MNTLFNPLSTKLNPLTVKESGIEIILLLPVKDRYGIEKRGLLQIAILPLTLYWIYTLR